MELSLSKIATIAGIGVAILGACGTMQDNKKAEQQRMDTLNGIKNEWSEMKTGINNEWTGMKNSMATEFNGWRDTLNRGGFLKSQNPGKPGGF